ncbi:PIG-L family deacetylase [Actinomarinicola tropica]|uniref:GlcNAc-PI de-N-acetylase n=1 Tax=Actinomarinicola tropica TaxID=2789776 RepID=A0A5Q2RN39_9ACTN|nr:PIG-L family deacetylase [Actinomarinicola tropica]QGG96824.1 GlcNAc-PI de-N-acetylase [Actinomarinicola tropica]
MGTVVFLHAHPDDEAIFTGGTMALLAAAGHRVVHVVATGGELGLAPPGLDMAATEVGRHRREETEAAAEILGIGRLEWLGFADSGMAGDPANHAPGSFWAADLEEAAERLALILREESADALVAYDDVGIYHHPDHVQVHRVGHRAATLAGVGTVYDATVDREHLHFVETHLVEEAILAGDLGLARSHIGAPSVLIDRVVDVREVLAVKRAAMAAHASQIPETTSALRLPTHHFADVYGWEWYVRHGPPGPIDHL